ncbi:radical SAM protein [Dehalococcoidia bacterium]|nr:radical SAM protein [Dehalococcoidia bacterium]
MTINSSLVSMWADTVINPGLAFRRLDNEMVLHATSLDIFRNSYVLNDSGGIIFEAKHEGQNIESLIAKLMTPDDSAEEVQQEIAAFCYRLLGEKIFLTREERANRTPSSITRRRSFLSRVAMNETDRYILKRYFEKQIPYKVDIELTYKCNLRCQHCYVAHLLNKTERNLSVKRLKEVLDELATIRCLRVNFTGGEMFMFPNVLEVVHYAINRGFAVELLTNGTLINEEIAEELAQMEVNCVCVSLYGFEKLHDEFTRVQGSFKQTIKALRILAGKGIPVVGSCAGTTRNYEEISQLKRWLWEEIGVYLDASYNIWPRVDGGMEPVKLRLSDNQMLDLMRSGQYAPKPTQCSAAISRFRISPDGTVYPCELLRIPLGHLNSSSFIEILEASKEIRNKVAQTPAQCKSCTYSRHCYRCPALGYIATGRLDLAPEESCRFARLYAYVRATLHAELAGSK